MDHRIVPLLRPAAFVVGAGLALLGASQASASPAMIRLGYSSCQVCHLSPQGRGLLTDYGRGIDDAQSARKGVYQTDAQRVRRLYQDLRVLAQATRSDDGASTDTSGAARLWYRNATALTGTVRFSGMVSADLPARDRQITPVQPLPSQPQVFVRQALVEFMPRAGVLLAIGRDTLPSGVEIADQATYMRGRNAQGLTDVPTQAKLFLSSRRGQIAPYVFGPSGHEAGGFRSSGAGLVGETYLLGDRLATGISARVARNGTYDERLLGVFARLGLGAWGVLAEHDLTARRPRADGRAFDQHTSYAQVFYYPVDWLVMSMTAERLSVAAPLSERRVAWRPEVSARLSPHLTLAASVRREDAGGRPITRVLVQLYLKTVN